MSLVEIMVIAVGLAMDAFAVALGIGTLRLASGSRAVFRLSFHFGLFQFLMPILGWLAGTRIAQFISAFDHWVAFALLAFVGARMVQSGLDPEGQSFKGDPSRGRTLIVLAIATSIDAFAIGLGLAVLEINVIYPSSIIGVFAAGFAAFGLSMGSQLGNWFGKRMEVLGGLIPIGIGVRVLISHLVT